MSQNPTTCGKPRLNSNEKLTGKLQSLYNSFYILDILNIRAGSASTREARRWRQATHSCDVTVVSSDHSPGAILATDDTAVNEDGLTKLS